MRADLLTVIAPYFNPVLWESRRTLHRAFAAHMQTSGVRLITVEAALGERLFEVTDASNPDHIQVRVRNMLWIKEALINLGIRLAQTKYIAWIDGDISFRDPEWAARTVHALQHYDILQPWRTCIDLGPKGEVIGLHKSFCSQCYLGAPMRSINIGGYEFWHPGYAWAARASALHKLGGLMEFAILGAADHHMALALLGKVDDSAPGKKLSPAYLKHLRIWQERAHRHALQVGYVEGVIEHGWHGMKEDRRYVSRWDIVTSEAVDPDTDLKRNLHGVPELAGNKPQLIHKVDRYFRQRQEDLNMIVPTARK